jgi:hypothetical protein
MDDWMQDYAEQMGDTPPGTPGWVSIVMLIAALVGIKLWLDSVRDQAGKK